MVLWEILPEFKANIVVILGNNLNVSGLFGILGQFLGNFVEF